MKQNSQISVKMVKHSPKFEKKKLKKKKKRERENFDKNGPNISPGVGFIKKKKKKKWYF